MLQQLGVDLWCLEGPQRRVGAASGGRTTVVRLSNGELLLHGPPEQPEAMGSDLEPIGPIRYLLAPNLWTVIDHVAWRRRAPELIVLAPPGWTGSSRPGARGDLSLSGARTGIDPIDEAIELQQLVGLPQLGEWLVLHPSSRSLLVGDIVRGEEPGGSPVRRLLDRLTLGGGSLNTRRDVRWLVADRSALRSSLQAVSRWSFDRVVPRLGAVVTAHAEQAFRHALRWVDGPGAYWQ